MKKIPYINSIFEKENKHHLLLQDLLRYSLVINELPLKQHKQFKLQEILNWTVRNNKKIKDRYDMSHIRYSKRVHDNEEVIKPRFDLLLQLELIHLVSFVKADKVNHRVPVYEYTESGIILAFIIKSLNLKKVLVITKEKDKIVELEKELEKVCQHMYEVLAGKINNSSAAATIFYSILFRKLKEKGNFSKLVESMYHIINTCNNIASVNDLVTRAIYSTFFDEQSKTAMFYETFKELDQDSKKLVLYKIKTSLENRFGDIQEVPSRKYEDFRFKMRSNYEHIAVQGYCKNCKCIQNFALHYSELAKFSLTKSGIRVNCDICKAKDSLLISNRIVELYVTY
jgi:hypothetical protein